MDDMTTLQELKQAAEQFVEARNWQEYHTPKNLVMALAVEAAELVEIFQWKTETESKAAAKGGALRDHAKEEMADVLAYLLNLANSLKIDLAEAFYQKMDKNNLKYPKDTPATF